jgi:NADH:ubiquinone oxidoreductase subunit F (NADH-binding)
MTITHGPAGSTRLLAGWLRTGRPASLAEHLDSYGAVPPLRPLGRARSIIETVADAGLAGRGGAWFPTATKMRAVAHGRGPAVMVVNAVESEPASDKDRLLMSVAPHLVLDGAALAGHAVGAEEIILAVRADLAAAVQAAVGERAGSGNWAPFRVEACPDGYVSSEETALIHHLNSGPAVPTFTPPRPFQRGVRGRPTLVQNAETLAHLALLVRYGARWFRSVGTSDAPGTTLVTIGGAVHRPGVYEVELGATLGDVLRRAGGARETLQAVLTGGYFGGWVPAPVLHDTPLTPEGMRRAGGLLGTGALLALPERSCGLAETARLATWLGTQSSGQCGSCFLGLPAIAADLTAIAGGGTPGHAKRLRDRLIVVTGRGACHHPDGVVRLVASALSTFAADTELHTTRGPCAGTHNRPLAPLPSTRPLQSARR